jgi:hypothetical protein
VRTPDRIAATVHVHPVFDSVADTLLVVVHDASAVDEVGHGGVILVGVEVEREEVLVEAHGCEVRGMRSRRGKKRWAYIAWRADGSAAACGLRSTVHLRQAVRLHGLSNARSPQNEPAISR